MIVNQIIENVATGLGLVGDGQTVQGTMAKNMLRDLNSAIAKLNMQSYILSAQTQKIVNCSGKAVFGPSDDADVHCDIVPALVKVVQRKVGDRFINLTAGRLSDIYNASRMGKASIYTVDYKEDAMTVTFDTEQPDTYSIIYLENFPNFKLNDVLPMGVSEVELLEAALAVETCKRYKLIDYLAMYQNDFNELKRLYRRRNAANRQLLYGDSNGSYLDSFANGRAGYGW